MKELVLVIFPTYERGSHFTEDVILPLMPNLKKKEKFVYENETHILRIKSLANSESIRGYDASLIYLSDECSMKQYNDLKWNVRGDDSKIRVVM